MVGEITSYDKVLNNIIIVIVLTRHQIYKIYETIYAINNDLKIN